MPAVTLAVLRDRVRQKVDLLGSDFATAGELDGYINRALWALDDKLNGVWRDYFLKEVTATVTGDEYELPADFYRLLGVDVYDAGHWLALHTYEWGERNDFRNQREMSARFNRYRLRGNMGGGSTLQFQPGFSAPTQLLVHYYPQRLALVADADAVTYPQGWEEWAVIRAALEVRSKEERDTTTLEKMLGLEEERLRLALPRRDGGEPLRMEDTRDARHARTMLTGRRW